jgi:hypothetical protein
MRKRNSTLDEQRYSCSDLEPGTSFPRRYRVRADGNQIAYSARLAHAYDEAQTAVENGAKKVSIYDERTRTRSMIGDVR